MSDNVPRSRAKILPGQSGRNGIWHAISLNLDTLKCPVCWLPMVNEIFICDNGHSVCRNCLRSCRHCPTCRGRLSGRRNFALEAVIHDVATHNSFFCEFSKYGCTFSGNLMELENHENDCRFKVGLQEGNRSMAETGGSSSNYQHHGDGRNLYHPRYELVPEERAQQASAAAAPGPSGFERSRESTSADFTPRTSGRATPTPNSTIRDRDASAVSATRVAGGGMQRTAALNRSASTQSASTQSESTLSAYSQSAYSQSAYSQSASTQSASTQSASTQSASTQSASTRSAHMQPSSTYSGRSTSAPIPTFSERIYAAAARRAMHASLLAGQASYSGASGSSAPFPPGFATTTAVAGTTTSTSTVSSAADLNAAAVTMANASNQRPNYSASQTPFNRAPGAGTAMNTINQSLIQIPVFPVQMIDLPPVNLIDVENRVHYLEIPVIHGPYIQLPYIQVPYVPVQYVQAPHVQASHVQAPHVQAPHVCRCTNEQDEEEDEDEEAPQFQAPHVEHVQALHVQSLHVQALHVQALHIQALQVQALHVQDRHVQDAHAQDPHAQAPHAQAPQLQDPQMQGVPQPPHEEQGRNLQQNSPGQPHPFAFSNWEDVRRHLADLGRNGCTCSEEERQYFNNLLNTPATPNGNAAQPILDALENTLFLHRCFWRSLAITQAHLLNMYRQQMAHMENVDQ